MTTLREKEIARQRTLELEQKRERTEFLRQLYLKEHPMYIETVFRSSSFSQSSQSPPSSIIVDFDLTNVYEGIHEMVKQRIITYTRRLGSTGVCTPPDDNHVCIQFPYNLDKELKHLPVYTLVQPGYIGAIWYCYGVFIVWSDCACCLWG